MSGTTATLVRTDDVEYDANGNITKYGDVTYEYDKLGRLVRENNPHEDIDKTVVWCYDISGNILSRTEYAYTTGAVGTPTATFAYAYAEGWKDQLVSFNGQSITYDDAGNPTSYRGASLSWTRGRLLASYNSITMQYDANGIRTRKVVPGTNYSTTTEFLYSGNNLLREKVSLAGPSQSSTIYKAYFYNSQGIVGFAQGGNTYTYRKNLFGDIVAIYQGATKIAEYTYDAWGNCTIVSDTASIGASNPFRYRGYYWDNDLQLYYLMSRYYDPQVGRFINADSLKYLSPQIVCGLNLYSYCENNPINKFDPLGHFSFEGLLSQLAATMLAQRVFRIWAIGDLIFNRGKGAWSDMRNIGWDIFNADEDKVIEAKCISFYKGVPVIKGDFDGGSMSFGWIFLDKLAKNNTLRHERGHSDQLMELGFLNYFIQIGIPSMWKNGDETPWELSASMLGGDTHANDFSSQEKNAAMDYFRRTQSPFGRIINIIQYIFYKD